MKSITSDSSAGKPSQPAPGRSPLRRAVLFLLAATVLALGCTSPTPVSPGRPGHSDYPYVPEVQTTLRVPGGTSPVWMPDGMSFLFSYDENLDSTGLYLAEVDGGQPVKLYPEAHNYDYTPSPDGEYVAFSTPALDGGVIVISLEGEIVTELGGARRPSWLGSDGIVYENSVQQLIYSSLFTGAHQLLSAAGYSPSVSPDGRYLAYLVNDGDSFSLRLQGIDPPTPASTIAWFVSPDLAWDASGGYLFATLFTGAFSGVARIEMGSSAPMDTVVDGAFSPSPGNGFLLVTDLNVDSEDGVLLLDLGGDDVYRLLDAGGRPAAAPSGTRALVETDEGILLVTW